MNAVLLWLCIGGVLVALELATATFYLLMLALGTIAGALVAAFDGSLFWQTLSASLAAALAIAGLRRSRFVRGKALQAAQDPNVNLDIGQTLHVAVWDENRHARAPYRGALWDIDLAGSAHSADGLYVIQEVRGNRLLVAPRAAADAVTASRP